MRSSWHRAPHRKTPKSIFVFISVDFHFKWMNSNMILNNQLLWAFPSKIDLETLDEYFSTTDKALYLALALLSQSTLRSHNTTPDGDPASGNCKEVLCLVMPNDSCICLRKPLSGPLRVGIGSQNRNIWNCYDRRDLSGVSALQRALFH